MHKPHLGNVATIILQYLLLKLIKERNNVMDNELVELN